MVNKKTEDTVNDETKPALTLSEESGLTMADAMRAIKDLNSKFEAQNEENNKLRAHLVKLEATNTSRTANKFGSVTIEKRICNSCGVDVAEGARCKYHPRGKINEIGFGVKHNRPQAIIIRQV